MVNKTYILSGFALLALFNNNKNKAQVSRSENKETDNNVFEIAVLRDDINKLKDRIKQLEEDAIEVFYYYPNKTNINDFMEWYNDTERMKRGNPFTIKKMYYWKQTTGLCYRNGQNIIAMKKTRDIKYFFKFLDKDDKPILTMEQLFKECL